MELLTVEQLAALLNKAVSSIQSDRVRNPNALPPVCRLPGTRRLLWRRTDVEKWLAAHIEKRAAEQPEPGMRRRPGRPTKAETVRRARRQGAPAVGDWARS